MGRSRVAQLRNNGRIASPVKSRVADPIPMFQALSGTGIGSNSSPQHTAPQRSFNSAGIAYRAIRSGRLMASVVRPENTIPLLPMLGIKEST